MFNRIEFITYNLSNPIEDEARHGRRHATREFQTIPILPTYQVLGFHVECLKSMPSHVNLTWLKYYELTKVCLKLTTENVFFNCVNDVNMVDAFTVLFPNIEWKALYRNTRYANPIVANPYNIKSVRSQIKRKVDVYVCDNISRRSNIYEKFVEFNTGISLLSIGGTLIMNMPTHGTKWFMVFMKRCTDLFSNVYICRPSVMYVGAFIVCSGFNGVTQTELEPILAIVEDNLADMQNDSDNTCSSYYFNIVESELIIRVTNALIGLNEHQVTNMSYYRTIHNDRSIQSLLKVRAEQWMNHNLSSYVHSSPNHCPTGMNV